MLAISWSLLVSATIVTSNQTISPRSGDITSQSLPAFCSDPPRDTCNFYSDCLESQYHCGPDGYPLKDGVYYCEKFSQDRAQLSPQGQTWMLDTMQCLQQALVPEAESTVGVTCASLENAAFASHSRCYIESGLCTLPPSDWVTILEIVGLAFFKTSDTFITALETAGGCLETYLFFAGQLL